MRVIVDYHSMCTDSYHSGEQYGEWHESNDFSVLGVREAAENENVGYRSEGYLIPDGSTHAHVVWIRYSTGDSFGRSDGNGAIVGVFGDRKVAEAALEALRKQEDEYSIEITDDFGRQIKMHNPGAGYFESIHSFNLDSYDLAHSPLRFTK